MTSGPSWASARVDKICDVATIRPILQQAQDAADFYNRNRASIEQAARFANQMAPTIRMIQQMAPSIAMVERMQRDMKMASMLARQHAQVTELLPTISVPTEAELVETQDRIAELVPEGEEEREQVAEQAAEIQADPEGKQLIEQLTGWVSGVMDRTKDVAAKAVPGLGLLLLAYLIFHVMRLANIGDAAVLFCAAGSLWLQVVQQYFK